MPQKSTLSNGRLTDRERQRLREAYARVPEWQPEQAPRRHSLLAKQTRRGWCDHCRELSVRWDDDGEPWCELCGGGLGRGMEMVEVDEPTTDPGISEEEFRKCVRWFLEWTGMTVEDLAEEAGMSSPGLEGLKHEARSLRPTTIHKVMVAMRDLLREGG